MDDKQFRDALGGLVFMAIARTDNSEERLRAIETLERANVSSNLMLLWGVQSANDLLAAETLINDRGFVEDAWLEEARTQTVFTLMHFIARVVHLYAHDGVSSANATALCGYAAMCAARNESGMEGAEDHWAAMPHLIKEYMSSEDKERG